jgi:peptide/nickel transport system substrate-binding protein
LKAVGAAGLATSSAGCSSSESDLGERVPTYELSYSSNISKTAVFEKGVPIVAENFRELGIDVEVSPLEFTKLWNDVLGDKRKHHSVMTYHNPAPTRLDPDEQVSRFRIDYAGNDGQSNLNHYTSCDYTGDAVNQASAASESNRETMVEDALKTAAEDRFAIPVTNLLVFGAGRSDKVDLERKGQAGLLPFNPHVYVESTPKDGENLVSPVQPTPLKTTNFPTIADSVFIANWCQLIHTPLFQYDENFELQNALAKDYNIINEGKTVEITLRDGTFHNGDPITAEDVKFTFEQLSSHAGVYPFAPNLPLDDIEVVSDKEVSFHFTEAFLPFVTAVAPRWGIFHKETWVENGAKENPQQFSMEGNIVGSGPFKVTDFKPGQYMQTEPHDGHPTQNPDHRLTMRVYRDEQSKLQAFKAGEIDVIRNMSPGGFNQMKDDLSDTLVPAKLKSFTSFIIYTQHQMTPNTFPEFRDALGKAVDRKKYNAVALYGESDPSLHPMQVEDNHPWAPSLDDVEKYTNKESGDVESARAQLEDAGWGWDDEDRLHYPTDADVSAPWPQGGDPTEEHFPCLNSDGDYVNESSS